MARGSPQKMYDSLIPRRYWLLCLTAAAAAVAAGLAVAVWSHRAGTADRILAAAQRGGLYPGLTILQPLDETLFPPDIAAPTFRWSDPQRNSDSWLVSVEFSDGQERVNALCSTNAWTPAQEQWETIRRGTVEDAAKVTVLGFEATSAKIQSKASVSIRTSRDAVNAPIFYREVNLPFVEAVKDTTRIRWRFGKISSQEQPPIVLQNLPVCGNCHSFSADGSVLGMDVDYANDRGSYVITPVAEDVSLDASKIISWGDFRREDGRQTFGMLSQVSPDGRYVVSTVKDRSVFVPRPNLAFSQLFFPIQGILVVYDRETKQYQALPGADDKRYVQTNATWSPDGKYLVFARSEVYRLKYARSESDSSVLLMPDECQEFLDGRQGFKFDLYRVPFNEGKGGTAEPLKGASGNGLSNYFPRYSPDGKWIVFCKAKNFMLLQADSELHIIPAEGGESRRLECNTNRMNSWHSWSPNGKWLVFSSKMNSPYTQLFLTHIDEQGHSSPAVLLSRFTSQDRAANIPEFVNLQPNAIKTIHEEFVDDISFLRSGLSNARRGHHELALAAYRKALELNAQNKGVHEAMGVSLLHLGRLEEARDAFLEAIEVEPSTSAYCNLGSLLAQLGQFGEAAKYFRQAVEMDPKFSLARYQLGTALLQLGEMEEGKTQLQEAVRLAPDDFLARCNLAGVLMQEGKLDEAVDHYRQVVQQQPDYIPALLSLASLRATSTDAAIRSAEEAITLALKSCELTGRRQALPLDVLAMAYAEAGRFSEAVATARDALESARTAKDEVFVKAIEGRLNLYLQHQPFRRSFGP